MSEGESSVPALRASDAERERAAGLLRDAMTSGRLGVEELDQRMQLVFAATTRDELERLLADVTVPAHDDHLLAATDASAPSGSARLPVRQGSDGTRRVLSILSGSERKGRWRLAPACSVITVLGGSKIDLSEAELGADVVELKLISVLGGSEVIVPDGLNVEVSDAAILAGNQVDVGDEHPDPGGPLVRVRLVSILSGGKVTRRSRPRLRPGREGSAGSESG